ncbi:hypothetical protein AVEN_132511-1 [Araneus ventricosus]|uniref:Uncharacterized protein n=1 Tax=Araneus ventricosus TaxID=182803 RepID=A0A4Y2PN89_ARAVE|nr:hypothetical protein AVEN_132511-1 [Araneus ventricosus]
MSTVRSPETRPPTNWPKAKRERRQLCRKNDPVLHNRRGLKGSRGATFEKITQVDRQRELITLWLPPMMKRRGERMFVVGEIVRHPNKSWRLNLSATPQRAWSKGFLSWNLEDERGLEKSSLRRG